jgi:hypothetical protein
MMQDAVQDLRSQIAAIEGRQIELIGERDEISFEAVVERRKLAIAKVESINAELGRLANELATVKAALGGASKREAIAQAAKRDEVERANASKVLELLDSFAQRGVALDEWVDKMIAEYMALCGEFRELVKLGFSPTTYRMVAITMRTTMLTKLMGTDLKIQHLAPGERKTFEGAIEGWSANIRARATARLNQIASAA